MARRHLPVLYVLTRAAFLFISSTIVIIITLLNSRNNFDDDNSALLENNRHVVRKFESFISLDETFVEKENKKEQVPMKTILFWTKYYDSIDFEFGLGQKPFIEAGCKISNCQTTNDRSWLNRSDAVLFHAYQYDPDDLPVNRSLQQRYVFFNHEALPNTNPTKVNYAIFRLGLAHYFNWTMTHRRDSDIFSPHPYGMLVRRSIYPPEVNHLPSKLPPGKFPSMVIPSVHPSTVAHKTKLMIYISSNCESFSRREEYLEVLSQHVQIDTYGRCGELQCEPWNGEECFEKLLPNYKFHLAFENSLCPDYVTEKFWRALKWGAVPVVYGAADYAAFAPPNSYIHVAEFASPKDLADYLLLLDRNDALYAKYFEWRKDWEVDRKPMIGWCDLCKKLNDPSIPVKSYANLSKWWFQEGPCYPAQNFIEQLIPHR